MDPNSVIATQGHTSHFFGEYTKDGTVTTDDGIDFPVYRHSVNDQFWLAHESSVSLADYKYPWFMRWDPKLPGSVGGNIQVGRRGLQCPTEATYVNAYDSAEGAFVDSTDEVRFTCLGEQHFFKSLFISTWSFTILNMVFKHIFYFFHLDTCDASPPAPVGATLVTDRLLRSEDCLGELNFFKIKLPEHASIVRRCI